MALRDLIANERRRQRGALWLAATAGVAASVAGIALLALSGWFITGAALAGIGGAVAAFNYLLPSAAIRLFAIVRTIGRYGERLEGHRAALKALSRIRPAIFAGLTGLSPRRALALSTGEAVARMVSDVDVVEIQFVRRSGSWSALAAVSAGVALTALGGRMCAVATLALFAVQVLGSQAIARRSTALEAGRVQQSTGRLKDALGAVLAAAPELAAYDLHAWAEHHVGTASNAVGRARAALHRADGWQAAFAAMMAGLATVVVMVLAHRAALPIVALVGLTAGVTMEGAAALARAFQQDGALREAGRRIDEVLPTVVPHYDHGVRSPRLAFGAPDGGWIELGLGERLALTGASGCGKTSLIERMMGLRSGEGWPVRIGGDRPRALDPVSLRALFAYAPQDAAPLSGTIRENLVLAAADASDDEFWQALHDAVLDERVRRMARGLDTWIGDVGERLSGGERRRLGLARALLRPAPWLVLDEPTEGLDPQTEARVVERLGFHLQRSGQGLILASHRPGPLALVERTLDFCERAAEKAA